jgi:arylformamidase
MEKVWLDLDQAGLDRAYDQRQFAPNMQDVLSSFAIRSEMTREKLGAAKSFKYGPRTNERVDFYPSRHRNAATQIFIHGGAWRGGAAKNYGFLAELFYTADVNLLVADFDSVEHSPKGLTSMLDQIRTMIAWTYTHAATLAIDPSKIHLFGHSSGAHLTANALATDWEKDYHVPRDIIRSATCCSGIYDLKPVRLSSRNSYLRLSDEIEEKLSPVRHANFIKTPLVVAYGELESPEFIRQARDFACRINLFRHPFEQAELVQIDQQNHFEILANITQPNNMLASEMLKKLLSN